jgi:purine-cytosine permease-like protein
LTVIVLGPSIAIYTTDQWLRRNVYDGVALNDVSNRSVAWYTGGFNVAGITAFLSGAFVAALFVQTDAFAGPLGTQLGGADLSWVAGPVVASCVYAAMTKLRYPDVVVREGNR